MTTTERPWVGQGIDRLDGPAKVSGSAAYSSDIVLPGMLHAVVVTSTIPSGRITKIDTSALLTLPGVRAVLTHENFPRLRPGPQVVFGWTPPPPLQDDRIFFHGQEVAVVIADSVPEATEAVRLIEIEYEEEPPLLDPGAAQPQPLPYSPDVARGDVEAGLAAADVTIEQTYETAENMNNPLGLMGAVASWDGDRLDLHDSTQWPVLVRQAMAQMFAVPESGVRVRVPYLGGGFGAGLAPWPYKALAAGAARVLGRPVKLVLTRPQMFRMVGHRPNASQRMRLGASRDGTLTAIDQRATVLGAIQRLPQGLLTAATPKVYACPNVAATERALLLNRRYPSAMRGPGEAEGSFALECALDELAYALDMDPLDLRIRNYSPDDPDTGQPWSSNALLDCYRVGAERFGWADRDPRPASTRDSEELVGLGMATAFYSGYQLPCHARVSVYADGTAAVRSAATDIGTGTYTVMTQVAADLLGLHPHEVDFHLGDSDMPDAPQSGGSLLAASLSNAIDDAVANLRRSLVALVADDPASALHDQDPDRVRASGGRLGPADDPAAGPTYAALLATRGLTELSADGYAEAADPAQLGLAQAGGFGARFVEVGVDPLIGRLRLRRIVSVTDSGRILNEKLARSQVLGGTVGGIGMAMFEAVATDPGTGRVANPTFGDYLIPVSADIPEMDIAFVGEPDRFSPTGVKGVGEIGLVGVAPAIANAVFHATGRRFRSLPITIDQLLA